MLHILHIYLLCTLIGLPALLGDAPRQTVTKALMSQRATHSRLERTHSRRAIVPSQIHRRDAMDVWGSYKTVSTPVSCQWFDIYLSENGHLACIQRPSSPFLTSVGGVSERDPLLYCRRCVRDWCALLYLVYLVFFGLYGVPDHQGQPGAMRVTSPPMLKARRNGPVTAPIAREKVHSPLHSTYRV